MPLEPLRHNLESQTYEVFERDAVKYDTYEEAVYQALKDWPTKLGEEDKVIVLMVVGAGKCMAEGKGICKAEVVMNSFDHSILSWEVLNLSTVNLEVDSSLESEVPMMTFFVVRPRALSTSISEGLFTSRQGSEGLCC